MPGSSAFRIAVRMSMSMHYSKITTGERARVLLNWDASVGFFRLHCFVYNFYYIWGYFQEVYLINWFKLPSTVKRHINTIRSPTMVLEIWKIAANSPTHHRNALASQSN